MKKILFLTALFAAVAATTVSAQGTPADAAARMQKMRELVKPQLVEKAKITPEQADKVLDINTVIGAARREIRTDASLSDEDKTKKMAALDEESAKKFKAIPLTDEQVKSVNAFFEEMRKNRQGGPRGNQ